MTDAIDDLCERAWLAWDDALGADRDGVDAVVDLVLAECPEPEPWEVLRETDQPIRSPRGHGPDLTILANEYGACQREPFLPALVVWIPADSCSDSRTNPGGDQ